MKRKILTFIILLSIMLLVMMVSTSMLFSQSIRLDESQTIIQAIKPLPSLILTQAQDVQAPLYVLIEHFWIQIFGIQIIYSRLLSLLFLLLSIPVLYQVYKESSDRRTALLAVGLFAFSPFIIWYSSEARTYTLFTLVTALNHVYFLRLLRSQGKEGRFGYWLSTVIGLYTHYFFLFYMLTQCLYVVWRGLVNLYWNKKQGKEDLLALMWKDRQPSLTFFLSLILGIICFIPWIVYVVRLGSAANTQPFISQPTSYDMFLTFSNFVFGFQPNNIESLLVSLWPLLVVGFFFVFTRRDRIPVMNLFYFVFITFFPVIFVFAVSYYIRPILLSRYLIFVIPTLFFIIAWTLFSYPKRLASFLLVLFFFSMVGLLFYQNVSNNTPVKEDYRGVDEYLNQQVRPTDIIVVSAPFTVYPIDYGYTGYARVDTIPFWDMYNQGAISPFTAKGLAEQMNGYKMVYRNLYLVLSYSQGYEDKIVKYMDTHFEKEAHVAFTPGLSVRKYKMRYN